MITQTKTIKAIAKLVEKFDNAIYDLRYLDENIDDPYHTPKDRKKFTRDLAKSGLKEIKLERKFLLSKLAALDKLEEMVPAALEECLAACAAVPATEE